MNMTDNEAEKETGAAHLERWRMSALLAIVLPT